MTLVDTPALQPTSWSSYGEIFTKRWVVETILDLVDYDAARDLTLVKLLEPSCGSGAFLLPALDRLLSSRRQFKRSYGEMSDAICAYDLQAEHVNKSHGRVVQRLTEDGCDRGAAIRLADGWLRAGDFLLDDNVPTADVIVGNPPYIRLEDVPDETNTAYRKRWTTMRGRADIYVGFIERSLDALSPGGQVGFICADRWMRNQYGADLRRLVTNKYAVAATWFMHDVDAFDAQVSAYPAITVLSHATQGSVVVAQTDATFGARQAAELAGWSRASGSDEISGDGYRAHRLPHWFSGDEMWPIGSPARLAFIEHLNDNFPPLHDPATGTRVSIGVATGADKVFVTKDETVAEAEQMLPLSMVRDIATGDFHWSGHYLVNPWGADGKLVDLVKLPKLKGYLETASADLLKRHVAQKNPKTWYRTIDKVNADLTDRPKLLLQDMKTTIHPVLEPGGWYPHHNLYFVVSEQWDIEALGGLLLSRVAQAFIEAYCVRMRGGTLRFQSQYLKRIRVPRLADLSVADRDVLIRAFRTRDVELATTTALRLYGLAELPE